MLDLQWDAVDDVRDRIGSRRVDRDLRGVGVDTIFTLTTTVPRSNGPAFTGLTIERPNGPPLYGPVRYTFPPVTVNGSPPNTKAFAPIAYAPTPASAP